MSAPGPSDSSNTPELDLLPFGELLTSIKNCTLCTGLPLGPKPILQVSPHAKILIVGQAPGRKAHEAGLPFDDPSGDRLRLWMGVDREQFYSDPRIACVPMGFCFPGTGKGGDLPPRAECAAAWRQPLMQGLRELELTLILGRYAIDWHLPEQAGESIQTIVAAWSDHWPKTLAMPHPSPRNNRWLRLNPWFEEEIIPLLQTRVGQILNA